MGLVLTPRGELVLETAPVGGALSDLLAIAGGDLRRVLTISDFSAAAELGVRTGIGEDRTVRYDTFPSFVQLAAEGPALRPL